jgi:N-acetylglutamate synthase-like GNAT family acetyltransferase
MPYQIEFATAADENRLRSIFLASDMAVVGDIEDHVVIKEDGNAYGGALLYQMDVDLFHLLTIVVQGDGRSRGLGSKLLQPMLQNPWSYCRDAVGDPQQSYRVTTVSRGSSRRFYQKNGLVDCAFDELTVPFNRQCEVCPELIECGSAAMVYQGQ